MKTVAATFLTACDVSKCVKTRRENLWVWRKSPWRHQPPTEHLHGQLCLPAQALSQHSLLTLHIWPPSQQAPPSPPFHALPLLLQTPAPSTQTRKFGIFRHYVLQSYSNYLTYSADVCDADLRCFRKRIKRKNRKSISHRNSFCFCGGKIFHQASYMCLCVCVLFLSSAVSQWGNEHETTKLWQNGKTSARSGKWCNH